MAEWIREFPVFTPEEISRLKAYAKDENYRLYILARKEIEATIDRAKRALNIATTAHERAKRALDVADAALRNATKAMGASSQALDTANKALSISREAYKISSDAASLASQARQNASSALNTSKVAKDIAEKAKGIADEAKATADYAKRLVNQLKGTVATIQADVGQIKADLGDVRNTLDNIRNNVIPDIESRLSTLRDTADSLVNWYKRFRQKVNEIREISNEKQKEINDIVNAINKVVTEELPTKIGEIINAVKTLVEEKIGYAKIEHATINIAGVTVKIPVVKAGEGIISKIGALMSDLNEFYQHLSAVPIKIRLKACLWEGACIDFGTIYAINLAEAVNAAKAALNVAKDAKELMEEVDDTGKYLATFFNKFLDLANIQATIAQLAGKAANVLNDLVLTLAQKLAEAMQLPGLAITATKQKLALPKLEYTAKKASKILPPTEVTIPTKTEVQGILKILQDGRIVEVVNEKERKVLKVAGGVVTPY